MEDLKKYVLVDDSKLKNSLEKGKLKYLSFISNDINYWKDLFTYDENKSELEAFFLYRTAGAFDINGYVDDGDIAPPVFDYLTNKLKAIKNVKLIKCKSNVEKREYYDSKRVVILILDEGTKLYLETDTANSLMYDLGDFLRGVLEKRFGKIWYQNYIRKFRLPQNKKGQWYIPFKYLYFYMLISDSLNNFELSNEEVECLKALEERAKYTHTLKNMILVAFGYNRFRGGIYSMTYSGKKIRDRLDLTMVDLKDMLEKIDNDFKFQKRIGDKRGYGSLKTIKFLLDNQRTLFPEIPVYTKEMELNNVKAITLRSKLIVKTLN